MHLTELSRQSGVPVSSIKFYRREGLLHPGRQTARTRADYDHTHLEHLRLIRALTEVGGLPLTEVRYVLGALASRPRSVREAISTDLARVDEPACDTSRASRLIQQLGWKHDSEEGSLHALASALAGLEGTGFELSDELVLELARAIEALARVEIERIPLRSPTEALRYLVLGRVLARPVLEALRELARQDRLTRRLDST